MGVYYCLNVLRKISSNLLLSGKGFEEPVIAVTQ